jgi:hypothetical protein
VRPNNPKPNNLLVANLKIKIFSSFNDSISASNLASGCYKLSPLSFDAPNTELTDCQKYLFSVKTLTSCIFMVGDCFDLSSQFAEPLKL